MYTITRHETSIPVEEYVEKFVDVPTFLAACKECPNYGTVWSCPPYSFDVPSYWKKYKTLELTASKITFDDQALNRTYTKEEMDQLLQDVLYKEKKALTRELFQQEKLHPGSVSLSAGTCQSCAACTRPKGSPCLMPEQLRYSIEALGGNVGLTIEKLLGLTLEWMEEGRLPHHFVLVCGLLLP
ncbi:MAG: DUF2284 domain-containing protein [Eubacteriales bacterium]|nr:DUF2284 domain-containing protein [Eubacteriales bacterium]